MKLAVLTRALSFLVLHDNDGGCFFVTLCFPTAQPGSYQAGETQCYSWN